jgi:hypothetical protein
MHSAFGKASGGGKRSAMRTAVPLPVIIRTLTDTQSAALVDISESGASVQGSKLPEPGEEVELSVGALSAFGRVAWSRRSKCGIEFDERLTLLDLVRLRQRAVSPLAAKLSVDERLALEHWVYGVAR